MASQDAGRSPGELRIAVCPVQRGEHRIDAVSGIAEYPRYFLLVKLLEDQSAAARGIRPRPGPS
jgi:hypothetical protein